ncbi:MAG: hypothetical protein COA67_04675 [Lutibacter sp.]|nr:MAG: hypothetical protein COA67_04675 [Lutibacter sp.]
MNAQEYAEIIVVQKTAKKESPIKEMYLNSITVENSIEASEIQKIETKPALFKYMELNKWTLVETISSQASNSAPLWISYVFREE